MDTDLSGMRPSVDLSQVSIMFQAGVVLIEVDSESTKQVFRDSKIDAVGPLKAIALNKKRYVVEN